MSQYALAVPTSLLLALSQGSNWLSTVTYALILGFLAVIKSWFIWVSTLLVALRQIQKAYFLSFSLILSVA
ncbi:hypothetical protein [Nostoc sp.]|uniref:hypothetical protein n=1 Tax=Nostoc sp. TaxID=1180 RepID=UPI002FF760D7